MTLMDDYLEWHPLQVASLDLDPVYPTLVAWADRHGLSTEERAWLVMCHVTYYHMGSGLTLFTRHPRASDIPEELGDLLTLPTGTERRAHRWQPRLADHLVELRTVLGPTGVWDWMAESGWGWKALNERIGTLRGNGRWAGYKTAEMLQKVCGAPTQATDAGHRFSSGPRHGLDRLFPDLPIGQSPETIAALDAATEFLAFELDEPDIAQVETSLCDFNSLVKGHYYLGHDIDAMQAQLLSPRCTVPADIWDARSEVFKRRFLGEYGAWTGIRVELNRRYATTGRLT